MEFIGRHFELNELNRLYQQPQGVLCIVYGRRRIGKTRLLTPQRVGAHWSSSEQIDVVAINWDKGQVLYGECKWQRGRALSLSDVEKLIERAGQIDLKSHWGRSLQRHFILFSRSGFTASAQNLAQETGAALVGLSELDAILAHAIR
ncbi:MAG: hypothetical protein ETSY2_07285 [Candidatus Entotheonella gemina]|uniref:DUF234 domain-containing protein n=1 Tax=Candidatus Entotheonella gemina TaxID=1429439 RepID=W4MD36_9BACT|nr:MAG: hypothetical protein ETSY2_07285 [Candidatus Entotheonella gemina]